MSKRIIIIIVVIAALASLIFFVTTKGNKTVINQNTAVQPQPDLSKLGLPLKVGNSWTYQRKVLAHEENEYPELLWEGNVTVTVTTIVRHGDKWHITFKVSGSIPENTPLPFSKELWYANNTLYDDASLEYEYTQFKFPLSVGLVISDDYTPEIRKERNDHLYQRYVDRLSPINIPDIASPTDCFVITDNVLSGDSETTFCPRIGIFKEYYKHRGTPLEFEWVLTDYNLK